MWPIRLCWLWVHSSTIASARQMGRAKWASPKHNTTDLILYRAGPVQQSVSYLGQGCGLIGGMGTTKARPEWDLIKKYMVSTWTSKVEWCGGKSVMLEPIDPRFESCLILVFYPIFVTLASTGCFSVNGPKYLIGLSCLMAGTARLAASVPWAKGAARSEMSRAVSGDPFGYH